MQYFKEAKCEYFLPLPVDFTGGLYPCLDDTYICSYFGVIIKERRLIKFIALDYIILQMKTLYACVGKVYIH